MKKEKKKIIIIVIVLIIIISVYYLFNLKEKSNNNEISQFYTEEESEENSEEKIKEEKQKIIVHIMGEVVREGIVEVDEGSRVCDVINEAGGLTENADITNINLAYQIEDGMKIIIPSKKATEDEQKNMQSNNEEEYIISGGGENVISSSNSKGGETLININSASKEELESLPGIGEAIATRIIEYRKTNGKFASIEDIKNVSGIGDSKFENIKNLICI